MKHKGASEEFQQKLAQGWGEAQKRRLARRARYEDYLRRKAAQEDPKNHNSA